MGISKTLKRFSRFCKGWMCSRRQRNLKHIHFSTLKNNNVNLPSKRFIAKGKYGFTFMNDTGQVIKVFFKSKRNVANNAANNANNAINAANNAVAKGHMVANMLKNNTYRAQRVNGLDFNALPQNVQKEIINMIENKEPTLSAIRMQYLGIDLFTAINKKYEETRRVAIYNLIMECHKLIRQINMLREEEFCHGDITLENIMIRITNATTVDMKLIDFDYLYRFKDEFKVYKLATEDIMRGEEEISQYIPPEFLCIYFQLHDDRRNTSSEIDKVYSRYCTNINMSTFLANIGIKTKKDAKEYFNKAYSRNMRYVSELVYSILENGNNGVKEPRLNELMNYLDYFRFGMTMTMFFSAFCPMNNHKQAITSKNNSINPVFKAFHNMRVLLIQMCEFSIQDRPDPDTVLTRMDEIVQEMTTKYQPPINPITLLDCHKINILQ